MEDRGEGCTRVDNVATPGWSLGWPTPETVAREAYGTSLDGVFVIVAWLTLLAFVVRLPVCVVFRSFK